MQENQHLIALQNVYLKIKLKKLESEAEGLNEELAQIQIANNELNEKGQESGKNLLIKIEQETVFYSQELNNLENCEAFKLNLDIEERIRELDNKVAEYKLFHKNQEFSVIMLYLISFLLGVLVYKLIISK